MNQLFQKIFGGLVAVSVGGANAADINWPELPRAGFISGRRAEMTDFKSGNAVFILGSKTEHSMPNTIARCAFWMGNSGASPPDFKILK